MAAKKNNDGLIGGSLVSPSEHNRIAQLKARQAREKAQKAKAEEPSEE